VQIGPFSGSKSTASFSSFTANTPILIHKTFVIPKKVNGIHSTKTKGGVTNINLIISFDGGQIYSLDRRLLNPRRPLAQPSKTEQEEGLQQYNPYIVLNPLKFLTRNHQIANIRGIKTTDTLLESTSMIFVYGNDIHLSYDSPSMEFDKLSSDFNCVMLLSIIFVLTVLVLLLRKANLTKILTDSWK